MIGMDCRIEVHRRSGIGLVRDWLSVGQSALDCTVGQEFLDGSAGH